MKKIFAVLFFILTLTIPMFFSIGSVSAETEQVKVVVSSCSILETPNNGANVIYTAGFGEVLEVVGTAETAGVSYYQVKIPNGLPNGWVIKNAVVDAESSSLKKSLDPNAKILNENVKVYTNETISNETTLKILGEEVVLEQYQEIKIIGGYNKKSETTKIMFEKDGEIFTGYVKTSDLLVDGFNGVIILIVFIFVLVASIVISIVLTTRKKRKNAKKKA